MMIVADSKEKNESAMEIRYHRVNHFQKRDDVKCVDVRDRERCDDDRDGDCEDRCDNVLPASAAYRAPFQAIHN
jgi:hypothetical protein